MYKTQAVNLSAVLDNVFPEYKKASEIDLTLKNDFNLYKAIDNAGNIFLIRNPASREFRDNAVIGMKPRFMCNAFEQKKEVRVKMKKTDRTTNTEMHLAGSIIDMSKF